MWWRLEGCRLEGFVDVFRFQDCFLLARTLPMRCIEQIATENVDEYAIVHAASLLPFYSLMRVTADRLGNRWPNSNLSNLKVGWAIVNVRCSQQFL